LSLSQELGILSEELQTLAQSLSVSENHGENRHPKPIDEEPVEPGPTLPAIDGPVATLNHTAVWGASGASIAGIVGGAIGALGGPLGVVIGSGVGLALGGAVGVVTWKDDSLCTHCGLCGVEFSFTIRKHHCRGCGEVFCDECTKNRKFISYPGIAFRDKMSRVCVTCNSTIDLF